MSESRNFLRFISFIGVIIGVLLIAAILLSSTCKAQAYDPQKTLTIFGFKGLNTAEGLFVATPDYAKVCNNVDFSRNGFPIISKRWGFDTVKTMTGIDSIVGLGTYQRSNRQSCLVFAVDDSTKGYGAIYATQYGSDRPDSARKIKDYWSIQNPTRFSQFNDRLFASNGQQQGIAWNGTRVRNFPVNTPGMPDIIPLSTSGRLNGEYRYAVFQVKVSRSGSDYIYIAGTLSPAVNVKNGQILLRNFTRAIGDSAVNYGNYLNDSLIDSVRLYIGRTKANPGPIDDEDTIWQIGSVQLKRDTTSNKFIGDTITFTDNVTDDTLTVANSIARLTVAQAKQGVGRDSTLAITARWGAPTFILADSVTTGSNVIYPGSASGAHNILGYAYAVTVADTVLGLESDTTRSMWVRTRRLAPADSTKTLHRITIGLPRIGAYDSGYVFNVYRASLLVFGRKYAFITPAGDTIWDIPKDPIKGVSWYDWDEWLKAMNNTRGGIRPDSVKAVDWFRCAQVPASQLTLVDSVRTDSLYYKGVRFNIPTQPEIFSQTFQWKSKLGGVSGSRIWWSAQYVDSQGNFGANSFDDFNRNDGDFITGAKEKQFGLVVKKNRASYVLPNGGGRPERVSTFGCVAPLSYISSDVGDLFVGDGGVYLETEGQALERIYNAGLVSEKLNNFVNMPDSVRRTITGFWLPQSRQAIFSADYPNTSSDTAFVMDFRAGQAWSTWTNLVPKFGCLYSKNSTIGSPPPQTFYFTKAGGKTIYTYATNNKDNNGNYPAITYQTVPLFPDRELEQIDEVGIIHTSTSYGDLCTVDAVNERDSAICAQKGFDSLGLHYVYKELGTIPSVASGIRITTGVLGSSTFSNGIEALEVLYRRVEKVSAK